jgi:diguanylate cyclase (GGDEF)-like protein
VPTRNGRRSGQAARAARAASTRPARPTRRSRTGAPARRATLALEVLGPILDALAEAGDLTPLAAARHLRRAIAEALGWRARLVPRPSPLAPELHARVERGAALIPVAPGVGALRLTGAPDEALRRVAALCAHAFARARSHARAPERRRADRSPLRVLVSAAGTAAGVPLANLLGAGVLAVPVTGAGAAAEACRLEPLDAALLELAADPGALATLEALRAEPAGADLPALVVGARADEPSRLRALELGADFLSPPISAAELRVRLENAVCRARSNRALRDEALTDPLTGLPNRRALEDRLHEELRRARRYRTPLACVMADLDHLKPLNDTLGHACGDQALQAMAGVLHAELRAIDFAARVGGDEFLLLLPHTGAAEAAVLAERIRLRLGAVRLGPAPAARAVGASFGVAELADGGDGEAMVAAADRALYQAKRDGRGLVRVAPAAPP